MSAWAWSRVAFSPGDTFLRVAEIGDTGLDGVVEPLETEVSLRGALVELGDMLAPPLSALLAAVQHGGESFLQPLGSQAAKRWRGTRQP